MIYLNKNGERMKYNRILRARFVSRPNRFIGKIEIDGRAEIAHVKNTGRCKELLLDGADILVNKSDNPSRKTKYDLVAVYKGDRLINIDSQAPNKVFHEWILKDTFFNNINKIKPEYTYGNSRFDFFVETPSEKCLVEVKGVTLERDGIVLFPDAPTERGVKHIAELERSLSDGYTPYIVFIIQMSGIDYFTPNVETHPAFSEALNQANKNGVNVLALDCRVTYDALEINGSIEVRL